MSANNSTSSLNSFFHRSRSDSNSHSISSKNSAPLRLSTQKMLAKAKDSTKSLVQDVFEKRVSLDSKSSSCSSTDGNPSKPKRSNSLNTIDKLKQSDNDENDSITSSFSNDNDKRMNKSLSPRPKHYSLPIPRKLTIKKPNPNSLSNVSNTVESPLLQDSSSSSSEPVVPSPLNAAAAAAEADIFSGTVRPGSFATACDFRLANEKRNDEFHALFKSVQERDLLIQDYKCALQKEILLQGHLFISEHHVCFKSNIFGWVTNLVISFAEITRVEKRMTAKIIPNGILIATNTSTHIFASLLSRDQTYDQIIKIWDLCKRSVLVISPHIKSSTNDHNDIETDESGSISSMDSTIILNTPPRLITEDDDSILQQQNDTAIISNNNSQLEIPSSSMTKKNPTVMTKSSTAENNTFASKSPIQQQRPRASSDVYTTRERRNLSFTPDVETSKKREIKQPDVYETLIKKKRVCPCNVQGQQYFHIALDETYTGSVEAMFQLLFKSDFFRGFLERYENFEDVQVSPWKHGNREITGKRKIKSSTMGIKIVKTLFQEKRVHRKFPYYCCVTSKKSMPDMPMGAVYSIQSRTSMTRISNNKVHVLVTFQVAFSKSGLVSSIIEKNAADDQLRLYRRLNSLLNKPELIRELVQDTHILEGLRLITSSSTVSQEQGPISWQQSLFSFIRKCRFIDLVYIVFCIVLLTHCVLALRLQRITHRLDLVQQSRSHQQGDAGTSQTNGNDMQWIHQQMSRMHHSLDQLKDETQGYNQRINNLNKQNQL